MSAELRRFVSLVRLKIRAVIFLNWLLELLIYTSTLFVLKHFFHFDISYLYLIIPLSIALALSILKPINDEKVALVIDKDLDLKERVITSLEFRETKSPIIERLLDDTINLLKTVDLRKVYPIRFRKRIRYAILVPSILFLLLVFYQNVFYPRFTSSRGTDLTTQNIIESDILRLEQKLVSERPELAKRLEILRREIEEKKIRKEEGLSVLKEITKEIERETSSNMDTNTKMDIKKMLEMVMNKMNNTNNNSQENNRSESGEGERRLTTDRGLSNEEVGSESGNYPTKDKSELNNGEGNSKDSSMGENTDTISNIEKERGTGSKVEGSSQGEMDTSAKEGKKGEDATGGKETVEEGGSLPGKGERENKLGEESERLSNQGVPQYVPGIAKEEGDIRLRIKNVGKEASPSTKEGGGSPIGSIEDPVRKEHVPSEYRETIKLYFERLKGE
ncbi:MAG: hypothetical protein N2380_06295 [bacterium]|nr:hypothetical protein [bacterium]